MLEGLKEKVWRANMLLPEYKLITFTWGNASEIDKESRLIVIKPSGVEYSKLTPDDMVVVDLDGRVVEGKLRPSSDTPTHIELYKAFPNIGGIVHTHSRYATVFAQAELDIPCFGTTHADYFYGAVPVSRNLTAEEIAEAYEKNTGIVIAETFRERKLDEIATPAVLVRKHGPFTWGSDSIKAAENAAVLEEVAAMSYLTMTLEPNVSQADKSIMDKHYFRKHGKNAYYGQIK